MSKFQNDLENEKLLGTYLNDIYSKLGYDFSRVFDKNMQHRGIDIIINHREKEYYIDEKAQLHYLNRKLTTFTFELSYLKDDQYRQGWLFDDNKLTTHYFLITSIFGNEKGDSIEKIDSCNVISVHRRKLVNLLVQKGLDQANLHLYESSIRKGNDFGEIKIPELDPRKEGSIHFSVNYQEKPVNLKLKLSYLVESKIAKYLYP